MTTRHVVKLPTPAEMAKALSVLGGMEAAAVTVGVTTNTQDGMITAVLGALSAILVYFVPNAKPKPNATTG